MNGITIDNGEFRFGPEFIRKAAELTQAEACLTREERFERLYEICRELGRTVGEGPGRSVGFEDNETAGGIFDSFRGGIAGIANCDYAFRKDGVFRFAFEAGSIVGNLLMMIMPESEDDPQPDADAVGNAFLEGLSNGINAALASGEISRPPVDELAELTVLIEKSGVLTAELIGKVRRLALQYRNHYRDAEVFRLGVHELGLEEEIPLSGFGEPAFWDGFLMGSMAMTLGSLESVDADPEVVKKLRADARRLKLEVVRGGKSIN